MQVLQVLTDDDRRGAQVFAVELGARLQELGCDVTTVGLAPGEVGGLEVPTLGKSMRSLRTSRALRNAMRTADVVAAHGSTTLPMCALAGLGTGTPFVYRQISDPVFWTPTIVRRLRTRFFYNTARHVVALSPITRSVVHERFGVPLNRMTVIPNAVNERRCPLANATAKTEARERLGLPSSPGPVVGYAGALTVEKGVADLLQAADPSHHLVIAGDGPERHSLERQAKASDRQCTFLGTVADPYDVYAASDVVVLPSRGGDTQPAMLIEAALAGRPCIATDIGAISDIVIDGETGRLIPALDLPALAAALLAVLGDPTEGARLGAGARTRALTNFSMSVVAQRWLDVLHRAAA